MTTAVPRVLLPPKEGPSGLSPPELAAAVLDGDLLRLGDAFLPIDQPVGQHERVATIRHLLSPDAVIARRAAAWVWGAIWHLEMPVASYIPTDVHAPPIDRSLATVHQVVLADGDVVRIDGVRVTSLMRTAVDLARAPEPEFDQQAFARLLAIAGTDVGRVIDELLRRPRLPHRRTALRRLQVLFTR